MIVTVCPIRQLPQALLLGASVVRHSPPSEHPPFVIGLADDPTRLPAGLTLPYPLIPVGELLPANELNRLSAQYTPTEFAAALKPAFIRAVFRRYPTADVVAYADPNVHFYGSVAAVAERLAGANTLLTPHLLRPPGDVAWPDEKFFQNVGLYSADFLAFRRSAETERLLAWWQDRVQPRAFVDFCAGLCTDQLWLMHVPVFFRDVLVVKDPAWHVALWNAPERSLHRRAGGWRVSQTPEPTEAGQPLLFVNFRGLSNPNDGFFAHQNRLQLAERPDIRALLAEYGQALGGSSPAALRLVQPAYGEQPEPAVLRGWRRRTTTTLRSVVQWLERVPLPAVRRS